MENTLRIRVSKESHKIYKNLTDKKSLFDTMKDMFFWCVLLAYKDGKKRTTLGPSTGIFEWGAFSEDIQKPILKMIAVETKDDFSILNSGDQKILEEFRVIIEEMAEAGLCELLLAFEEKQIDHNSLFSLLIKNK